MYDDLARTQQPTPFEWFVVNAVIPSVVLSLALWSPPVPAVHPTAIEFDHHGFFVMPCEPFGPDTLCEPFGPIADTFPILIRMPQPVYPTRLRRAGVEDHVVLRALVNTNGRVDSASILIVHATSTPLAMSARRALMSALYRPGRFGGRPIAAWISIAIDFTRTRGAT